MSAVSPHSMSQRESVQAIVEQIRPSLRRTILVLNGKGGTGKTTTTANLLACIAAALGEMRETTPERGRVLGVDLDPQGNLGLDLNYRHTDEDDEGQSVVNALMGSGDLRVIRDVRPGLDVVPGGELLVHVAGILLTSGHSRKGRDPLLSVARAFAEVARGYEWVVVDCPPGHPELQLIAAVLGRYIVIPAGWDEASLEGMDRVANVITQAREYNTQLVPLGVLLFGFDRKNLRSRKGPDGEVLVKEVGLLARTRAEVTQRLAEAQEDVPPEARIDVPVLQTVITSAPELAKLCRGHGRVVAEFADAVATPEGAAQMRKLGVGISAESAETAAAEMEALTEEILRRALEMEASR